MSMCAHPHLRGSGSSILSACRALLYTSPFVTTAIMPCEHVSTLKGSSPEPAIPAHTRIAWRAAALVYVGSHSIAAAVSACHHVSINTVPSRALPSPTYPSVPIPDCPSSCGLPPGCSAASPSAAMGPMARPSPQMSVLVCPSTHAPSPPSRVPLYHTVTCVSAAEYAAMAVEYAPLAWCRLPSLRLQ